MPIPAASNRSARSGSGRGNSSGNNGSNVRNNNRIVQHISKKLATSLSNKLVGVGSPRAPTFFLLGTKRLSELFKLQGLMAGKRLPPITFRFEMIDLLF